MTVGKHTLAVLALLCLATCAHAQAQPRLLAEMAAAAVAVKGASAIEFLGTSQAVGDTVSAQSPTASTDLWLVIGHRTASDTPAPTPPSDWTTVGSNQQGGAEGTSQVHAYRFGALDTSQRFTNASQTLAVRYGGVSSVGGHANRVIGNASPIYFNGFTLTNTSGTSWLVGLTAGRTASTNNATAREAPTNMVSRHLYTGSGSVLLMHAHDTDGGAATWNTQGNSTAVNSRSYTTALELIP